MLKTVSVSTAPPSRSPMSRPAIVTTGVGADHARVERREPGREDEPGHEERQEPMPRILGEGHVAPGSREEWKAADVLREDEERNEAEEVDRRRDREKRAAHRDAVERRPPSQRRDDPERDAGEHPDDDCAPSQGESDGQPLEDLRPHRDVVLVRVAEVEVEDEALHVDPVLLVERLVEPERVTDLLDEGGGRLPARAKRGGIGGGERVEDEEGDPAHDDEQEDAPEYAPADVARYRGRENPGEGGRAAPRQPGPGSGLRPFGKL